jgi:hypothetical protein
MGLVEDFRTENGGKVWYTELAAEYPEGLCKTWAQEFHMHGTEYGDESAESPQKRSRGAPMSPSVAGRASAVLVVEPLVSRPLYDQQGPVRNDNCFKQELF